MHSATLPFGMYGAAAPAHYDVNGMRLASSPHFPASTIQHAQPSHSPARVLGPSATLPAPQTQPKEDVLIKTDDEEADLQRARAMAALLKVSMPAGSCISVSWGLGGVRVFGFQRWPHLTRLGRVSLFSVAGRGNDVVCLSAFGF